VNRKYIDKVASTTGLLLAAVLLIAGGLLTWGYSFTNDQVKSQLAEQNITFPPSGSGAITSLPAVDQPFMAKYAGEQMLNGRQAEVYADHFIAVHLSEIAGGKTYSEVSAAAQADPTNTGLAAQVQILFRGSTLRGLLLYGYAFWQIGQIAMYAALVAGLSGVLFLLLALLGFMHARGTEIHPKVLIEA
jgi:hypothetical protein